MNVFTKADLCVMWQRPLGRQYNIAITKIHEAISDTKGDITICFSGGKDSSLLLDLYCSVIINTPYADSPIKVVFADTTNETRAMYEFVDYFISYIEKKYRVNIDLDKVRPPRNLTWATYVKENGIPLISKAQSKAVRAIKNDMRKTGCDYETLCKLACQDIKAVNALFDMGFSKTGVLSLTGFVSSRQTFGKKFMVAKKWLPMVNCDVDLNHLCCINIKEAALNRVDGDNRMTGEQAAESKFREAAYLKTGCNIRLPNGKYVSKPFGAMTKDGILYALSYQGTPICSDYGEIVQDQGGHYRCTKAQRTGCALCGFGCQYDVDRFVRLQETEPAKINFAFKSKNDGGAGYKEAIEYMNEYCGTQVKIPQMT